MPTSCTCMNVLRRFVSWRHSDGCSRGCWIKIHPWWKGQGFRYYPGVHYVDPGCVWERESCWRHWLMNFTNKYMCICTVDNLVNCHTSEFTVLFENYLCLHMCRTCTCSLYVRWYLTLICSVTWNTRGCHKVNPLFTPAACLGSNTNCSRGRHRTSEGDGSEGEWAPLPKLEADYEAGVNSCGDAAVALVVIILVSVRACCSKKTIQVRLCFSSVGGFFWSGKRCHLFEAGGWGGEAPLCHFQMGFTDAAATPGYSFSRLGVSSCQASCCPYPVSGFFLIDFKSFSVPFLVWI